jgi:hypothetical protein
LVLLGIITFHPAEPEILLQFSHRNDAAWRFDWPACLRASTTGQTNRRPTNLDGHALNGRFANPATPQSFRPLRFSNRPFSAVWNLIPPPDWLIYFSVKKMTFKQMKKQEAESRMAAIRRARRSPAAAAAEQRRASLVGNGAKWRITNLNEVARAMAKHWG